MSDVTEASQVRNDTLLSSCPTIREQTECFRFLDLPAELRLNVYEELLVVGKIFYTPDSYDIEAGPERIAHWKEYAVPPLAILRTCKQIYAEAEEVYLSKNLFVLPDNFHLRQPFSATPEPMIPHPARWVFSAAAVKKLKNISFSLNTRTKAPIGIIRDDRNQSAPSNGPGFAHYSPADRLRKAHDQAFGRLKKHWITVLLKMKTLSQALQLQYMEIDSTASNCPLGCCHEATYAVAGMKHLKSARYRILVQPNVEATKDLLNICTIVFDNLGSDEDITEALMKERYGCELSTGVDIWESWRI